MPTELQTTKVCFKAAGCKYDSVVVKTRKKKKNHTKKLPPSLLLPFFNVFNNEKFCNSQTWD